MACLNIYGREWLNVPSSLCELKQHEKFSLFQYTCVYRDVDIHPNKQSESPKCTKYDPERNLESFSVGKTYRIVRCSFGPTSRFRPSESHTRKRGSRITGTGYPGDRNGVRPA